MWVISHGLLAPVRSAISWLSLSQGNLFPDNFPFLLNNVSPSLQAGFPLQVLRPLYRSIILSLIALFHELQQQFIGGIDDSPGEEGTVVVKVGPSEEHGHAAPPLPPNC